MSGDNLQALANRTIDAYIATDKGERQQPTSLDESERRLNKSDFTYHEEDNTFTCPAAARPYTKCARAKKGRGFIKAMLTYVRIALIKHHAAANPKKAKLVRLPPMTMNR